MIDNVEGDIWIPHKKIVPEVVKRIPEKNTQIRLYCRSGVRSAKAMEALMSVGYTQVYNAGGIAEARSERGL